MNLVRDRARLVAAITLTWHVVAIAVLSAALSCDAGTASEHAGMENCPLHRSAPACPLHAEKHGTHECDCPTIGCAETDEAFMALFGAVGVLPTVTGIPIPREAGGASPRVAASEHLRARIPLSPPPRA